MKKSLLIFDADGVLLDSLHLACVNFNKIATAYFPSLPYVENQNDFSFVFSGPLKTSLRRFGLTDTESTFFFNKHSEMMLIDSGAIKPFDIVLKALSEKKNLYEYAIVSSSYSETIVNVLKKSKFYKDTLFSHILGRELNKPKNEKIKMIIADKKIDPRQAIYICDMVSDILYCKEVPIDTACVGYGYHPLDYLSVFNPKYTIKNPDDFLFFSPNL